MRAPLLAVLMLLPHAAGAGDGEVAEAGELAEPERSAPPTRALWVQPLPVTFYALALGKQSWLLPVGVTWPVTDTLDLVSEVTVSTGVPSGCGTSAFAFWGSVGTQLRAEGAQGPLDGVFLQPKLLLRHLRAGQGVCQEDVGDRLPNESEASVGVDFGLQRTVGTLYLAVVMGVHLGYCWNCPAGSLLSFGPLSGDFPRGNRLKLGFNVNFVRLGMAF